MKMTPEEKMKRCSERIAQSAKKREEKKRKPLTMAEIEAFHKAYDARVTPPYTGPLKPGDDVYVKWHIETRISFTRARIQKIVPSVFKDEMVAVLEWYANGRESTYSMNDLILASEYEQSPECQQRDAMWLESMR